MKMNEKFGMIVTAIIGSTIATVATAIWTTMDVQDQVRKELDEREQKNNEEA